MTVTFGTDATALRLYDLIPSCTQRSRGGNVGLKDETASRLKSPWPRLLPPGCCNYEKIISPSSTNHADGFLYLLRTVVSRARPRSRPLLRLRPKSTAQPQTNRCPATHGGDCLYNYLR